MRTKIHRREVNQIEITSDIYLHFMRRVHPEFVAQLIIFASIHSRALLITLDFDYRRTADEDPFLMYNL